MKQKENHLDTQHKETKTSIKGYQQHWYNVLVQEATQVHDTKWLQQPAC